MKVLVHRPDWANRWIPYFRKTLSNRYEVVETSSDQASELEQLSKDADVLISMWFNGIVSYWTRFFPEKKIITYLRRYELFELGRLDQDADFTAIDAIIFCNSALKHYFDISSFDKPGSTWLHYNAVDLTNFPLKKGKEKTHKIGMVGFTRHIKNAPLALMILEQLPEQYTLHFADKHREGRVISELLFLAQELGVLHKFSLYDFIHVDAMPKFYQDKDIILSTSMNEGNPNCVIEAMACGCKPVIYQWPGAKDQFPPSHVFRTVEEACGRITESRTEPEIYRDWIRQKYSLENIGKIHEVIESIMQ